VGTAPRPSSQHAGGVNVVFCDGSARFLNENIDKDTYVKLLTSNGVAYGEQTLSGNY
jgi:prepilin-type processing-associated H-X9-DG protein